MAIEYPTWAPKDLCEHHSVILGHINSEKSKMTRTKGFEIMESLLLNGEMKNVWPVIKKYSESGYLKTMVEKKIDLPEFMGEVTTLTNNTYGFRLYSNAQTAYAYSLIKYKSKKEKKEYYNNVKTLALELSKFIKNTEFDYSPRRFHPNYVRSDHEDVKMFEDHEAGFELSNILLKLSEEAAATESMTDNETQVLPYPNIKNAQRTAFIRVLSLKFMDDYKSYLYRTQATVARCVLNDPSIGENTIKDALRGWSGDLNTIPEWNIIA